MFFLRKGSTSVKLKAASPKKQFYFFPVPLDILQIDNLWQFENLTKLQLDNNIIEKIEALESLVHLVWLGKMQAYGAGCFLRRKAICDKARTSHSSSNTTDRSFPREGC